MPEENFENHKQNNRENKLQIFISSLAQLNPITAAMAEAYNLEMDQKRWEYTEEFFREVKEYMEINEERLLEIESENDPYENLQIMHIAIENANREHREAKRKEYAKLFVNSILLGNQMNFDEKRLFIQLFNELSDADITLLGKFSQTSNVIGNGMALEDFRQFDLTEIVPLVVRLEARGIIIERHDINRIERWEGSINSFESIWRNKVYGLSPLGFRFCQFLKGE